MKKLFARLFSLFSEVKKQVLAIKKLVLTIYDSPIFKLIRHLLKFLFIPLILLKKKLKARREFHHADNKKHRESVAKELLLVLGGFSNIKKLKCTSKTLIIRLEMPYILCQDQLTKFGFKYSKLDGHTLYLIFGFHCKTIFKVIKAVWKALTIEHLPLGHKGRRKFDKKIAKEERAKQKLLEKERKAAAKAKKIQDKKDAKQARLDAKLKKAEEKRLKKEEKARLKAEKKLKKENKKREKALKKKQARLRKLAKRKEKAANQQRRAKEKLVQQRSKKLQAASKKQAALKRKAAAKRQAQLAKQRKLRHKKKKKRR